MLRSSRNSRQAVSLFRYAEQVVLSAGFGWEIAWQRERAGRLFDERDLLREAAWVILCSGFRESTVRSLFNYISLCFCDWESSSEISRHRPTCVATAAARFRNLRKLEAIADIAQIVARDGFTAVSERISQNPIASLQLMPYIGQVTSWHLAKNLGLNVAKNDRHLARIALSLGYEDAHSLCDVIASETREPTSVVDIVLWRFAVISRKAPPALLNEHFSLEWNQDRPPPA